MVLHQTSAQSATAFHVRTQPLWSEPGAFLYRPTSAMVILHPTYLQGFVSSEFFNVLRLWMIWCGSCQIVDDMVWFWSCIFPGGGKRPWRDVRSEVLALVWMNCIWSSLCAYPFTEKDSGHCSCFLIHHFLLCLPRILPLTHDIHICYKQQKGNNKQLTLYQQAIKFVIMVSHNLILLYMVFNFFPIVSKNISKCFCNA